MQVCLSDRNLLIMPHMYCLVILAAGLYTVYTYPFFGPAYYPQDDYTEALSLQEPVYGPDPYPFHTQNNPYLDFVSKRGDIDAQKRSDLNRLIRRLIALYGSNDIEYSGRSTGVRFGPGGR